MPQHASAGVVLGHLVFAVLKIKRAQAAGERKAGGRRPCGASHTQNTKVQDCIKVVVLRQNEVLTVNCSKIRRGWDCCQQIPKRLSVPRMFIEDECEPPPMVDKPSCLSSLTTHVS